MWGLCWNSGECQEGSREYGVLGSPKYPKLRQAHASGTPWNLHDRSSSRRRKASKHFMSVATSADRRGELFFVGVRFWAVKNV